ncbi:MAG: DNA polymerase Y family protein [Beijerinckiaceae bacterium]|nr:DNA polymerase Y family protein [Beijerinckiaceae bacterium]
MRFLSLFLPRLATDRITRRREALDPRAPDRESPLVTVAKIKGAYRLAALNEGAARLGLKTGLALADARAMVPTLAIHDADPSGDTETLLALADWCKLFTPLAATDGPNGIVLDITGAAHLFGGESALIATITQRLGRQGFGARAAIAGTPAAAWAIARHGGQNNIVPEKTPEAALAKIFGAMPLAALRIETHVVAELGQAGLRRIGDLLLRPRAPIVARFGSNVFDRLDELLGRARSPISPRFDAPAFIAERRFAEGLTHRDHIETAILALCTDLCGLLARHGEGARRLDVSLFRVDGAVKHIAAGTSRPLRDPKAMARLFHERIETIGEDGLETGYGFDVIRLAALSAERLDAAQGCFDTNEASASLDDLVDRLGARFGLARITQLVPRDTHHPEQASAASPVHLRPPTPRDHPLPLLAASWPTASWDHGGDEQVPALPERPIRLLRRPEPIDTIAGVPDGPPLRFRWRRVMHQVAAIEGPERIAPEWWKGTALARDYFRAEDTAGQRFWLYREGLYQETPDPRWFMHGLFA